MDKVSKNGLRAILGLAPKISIVGVLTMNLTIEIIEFDPSPENVKTRIWKKCFNDFFEKSIFLDFLGIFWCKNTLKIGENAKNSTPDILTIFYPTVLM